MEEKLDKIIRLLESINASLARPTIRPHDTEPTSIDQRIKTLKADAEKMRIKAGHGGRHGH